MGGGRGGGLDAGLFALKTISAYAPKIDIDLRIIIKFL